MGILSWLNPLNWFRRRTPAPSTTTTSTPASVSNTPERTAPASSGPLGRDAHPQCGALTAAGDQCRRSARAGSKYCGSHKGYRPPTAEAAAGAKDTLPRHKSAADTVPAVRGVTSKRQGGLQTQCGALTAAGDQCRRSSRDGSKYCASHKGYRPPTAGGAAGAKDTKPSVKGARDTKPSTRKATSKNGSNGHVSHGQYRLYQKGNRYYFSKKSTTQAKQDGAAPVAKMPAGRSVVVTPNGLPVLKKTS